MRIALSIGSAIVAKRARLIPSERAHPLVRSVAVLADHARETRNAPLLAYTLLRDINDTEEDAQALIELVQGFVRRSGVRPRVSLIPYSPLGSDDTFRASIEERAIAFRDHVGSRGIPVLRRHSGGADIEAACGQLGLRLARAASAPRHKPGSTPRQADTP